MKILLAEDVRAVAALMAARLQSFGHEVILAENGRVAVELFRSAAPDLILMDITMPEVDGFGAASRIRAIEATQQWAWTPILFLTATDTVENLIAAIEAGGDDFIPKTVPEPVLQAKMKALARIAAMRQQLIRANRQLQELATHDGLTGLYNRRQMDLLLDAAWAEAVRTGQPFGLYMLDIDNFKKFNDRYGHHAGDECLRSVAGAMAGAVHAANRTGLTRGAFPARYGGEEFVVVLPGGHGRGVCAARRDHPWRSTRAGYPTREKFRPWCGDALPGRRVGGSRPRPARADVPRGRSAPLPGQGCRPRPRGAGLREVAGLRPTAERSSGIR